MKNNNASRGKLQVPNEQNDAHHDGLVFEKE